MNNVEFELDIAKEGEPEHEGLVYRGKLIPAKHKFRGPGIPMAIGTGFPDFVAFKFSNRLEYPDDLLGWYVQGVEVKSNGYLDKEEKAKCDWLLANNIFARILISSKGLKRGEITYTEYETNKEKM